MTWAKPGASSSNRPNHVVAIISARLTTTSAANHHDRPGQQHQKRRGVIPEAAPPLDVPRMVDRRADGAKDAKRRPDDDDDAGNTEPPAGALHLVDLRRDEVDPLRKILQHEIDQRRASRRVGGDRGRETRTAAEAAETERAACSRRSRRRNVRSSLVKRRRTASQAARPARAVSRTTGRPTRPSVCRSRRATPPGGGDGPAALTTRLDENRSTPRRHEPGLRRPGRSGFAVLRGPPPGLSHRWPERAAARTRWRPASARSEPAPAGLDR